MKAIAKIVLITICTLFIYSCTSKLTVKEELPKYLEQLSDILYKERANFKNYKDIAFKNFVSEVNLKLALHDEIIPKYREVIDLLKEIKVNTKELQTLHKERIELSNDYFNSLNTLLEETNSASSQKILLAREKVLKKIESIEKEWKTEILELGKDYDLDLSEFFKEPEAAGH